MFRQLWVKAAILSAAALVLVWAQPIRAAESGGSVRGVVKSSSGVPLSGAFVKLHNGERRLTFMVISQAQGHYIASNLPAGQYTVQGIGNGFQSVPQSVDVTSGKAAAADLSLTAPQPTMLPNGWPGRPGKVGGVEMWAHEPQTPLADGAAKPILESKCTQCHETERIVLLRFDPEKWKSTVEQMRGYIRQLHLRDLTDEEEKTVVAYLAKNYSGKPGSHNERPDPNSRLPHTLLKGEAARYIAFDYGLPTPDRDPHDLTLDSKGNAWMSERNACCLAKFDAETFTFSEFTPPQGPNKSQLGTPITTAPGDVIWIQDVANRRWLSFDTKTEKFTAYPVPETIKVDPIRTNTLVIDPNGMVWGATGTHVMGLDPKTGKYVAYPIPYWVKNKKSAVGYGMAVSGDGKIWFAERDPSLIGRLDPATGKIDEFQPPMPVSIPRRMGADAAGNIWVALHEAGKLMKIDYETAKMTVYDPPTKNAAPYMVSPDLKNNLIWFSEQAADKIVRFDPKTQTFLELTVPNAESDMRRIEVDKHMPNRVWWAGDTSNHIGYIELIK
jgi:streptogramin lyase